MATSQIQYNAALHSAFAGIKMGMCNFDDQHVLAVGDYVTHQHGGIDQLVGEVLAIEGPLVTVDWTASQHIGPARTTVVERQALVYTSYRPSQYGGPGAHNRSTSWLLSAVSKGWNVCGNDATAPTQMSKGHDGYAHGWLRGQRVDVRFDHTGRIVMARTLGGRYGNQANPYSVVVDGPDAGHTAHMWLISK